MFIQNVGIIDILTIKLAGFDSESLPFSNSKLNFTFTLTNMFTQNTVLIIIGVMMVSLQHFGLKEPIKYCILMSILMAYYSYGLPNITWMLFIKFMIFLVLLVNGRIDYQRIDGYTVYFMYIHFLVFTQIWFNNDRNISYNIYSIVFECIYGYLVCSYIEWFGHKTMFIYNVDVVYSRKMVMDHKTHHIICNQEDTVINGSKYKEIWTSGFMLPFTISLPYGYNFIMTGLTPLLLTGFFPCKIAHIVLLFPVLIGNYLHPYLHMKQEEYNQYHWMLNKFLFQTDLFQYMRRNHLVHHITGSHNFSFLPFYWDIWFNTHYKYFQIVPLT